MHIKRRRATRHCGSYIIAARTGHSALRLPQLLQSFSEVFPVTVHCPSRGNTESLLGELFVLFLFLFEKD